MREAKKTIKNDKIINEIQDKFRKNVYFSTAVDLYVFDKKLRLLLLDALERIEVSIRTEVAYYLGKKDPFVHMKPDLLHGNFTKKIGANNKTHYEKWQEKLKELIKGSKEDFATHFKEKYNGDMPIWVIIELWDFGMLYHFFKGMKVSDQAEIEKKYKIQEPKILSQWLYTLNYVRNVCAHHSRLFNRSLNVQPAFPKKYKIRYFDHLSSDVNAKSRIYSVIAIVQYLLKNINPNSSWDDRLKELCKTFPRVEGIISLANAGFPESWQDLDLWNCKEL